MKTINLGDFYSSINSDNYLCEVTNEVAELLFLYKRLEEAQRRLIYKHKVYFSLDRNDGIENDAMPLTPSVHEKYEQKMMLQELYGIYPASSLSTCMHISFLK